MAVLLQAFLQIDREHLKLSLKSYTISPQNVMEFLSIFQFF